VRIKTSTVHIILGKLLIALHSARNAVVRVYYNFQLCSLAVVWQKVKLKSANFLKFRDHIFGVFGAPCGKAVQDYAKFVAS